MVYTYLFPHEYGKNEGALELDEMGELSGDAQFVVEVGDGSRVGGTVGMD